MKKTRLGSMAFVVIGCLVLTVLAIFVIVYTLTMNTVSEAIGVFLGGMVLCVVGWKLLWYWHSLLFKDLMICCMDCNEYFEERGIKKQVKYIYGKMYVLYTCPNCGASIGPPFSY